MRILPILFNTDMVRALLDGRKTVTRRIIKNKDIVNAWDCEADGTPIAFVDQWTGDHYPPTHPCPYCPGDILYARETWRPNDFPWMDEKYIYKADEHNADWNLHKWRPSIHMPKEAARLFLRVTGVRVEHLKDIMLDPPGPNNQVVKEGFCHGSDFVATWEKTLKPADRAIYGWEANPWVWVIEFGRCEKPEEAQA